MASPLAGPQVAVEATLDFQGKVLMGDADARPGGMYRSGARRPRPAPPRPSRARFQSFSGGATGRDD